MPLSNDPKLPPKVQAFQPKSLDVGRIEVKAFQPRSFGGGPAKQDYANFKSEYGSLANTDPESSTHFALFPESKKLLGIDRAERTHVEGLIRAEVEAQVEALRAQAYQEAYEKGLVEGHEKARVDFAAEMTPVYESFQNWLKQCDEIKHEFYVANEKAMIQMLMQAGRYVILRELKTDTDYIKRLCSEVIDKVGAKDYVRIQLNSEDFARMEEIRDFLKVEFPDLKNMQFEVTDSLPLGGCKVETDLSRINASVETQLQSVRTTLENL